MKVEIAGAVVFAGLGLLVGAIRVERAIAVARREAERAGKCKEARMWGLCPVNEHGCNKLCTTYILK